jgi:hypothetical protein
LLSTKNKNKKQNAFLIIPSSPSQEEEEDTISSHSLWPNQIMFTVFRFPTSHSQEKVTFQDLSKLPWGHFTHNPRAVTMKL